jgi:hypothetical protein
MTTTYKQIQLTNTDIGDIAVNAYIPYGNVTRRINTPYNCCNTFTVTSSTSDVIMINDPGFYKISYSLTGMAAAAGDVTIALVTNGSEVYTVSQYVADAAGSVNLTIIYTIRVSPNCSNNPSNTPVSVQIQNTGIALTGVSGNMIIEKV